MKHEVLRHEESSVEFASSRRRVLKHLITGDKPWSKNVRLLTEACIETPDTAFDFSINACVRLLTEACIETENIESRLSAIQVRLLTEACIET